MKQHLRCIYAKRKLEKQICFCKKYFIILHKKCITTLLVSYLTARTPRANFEGHRACTTDYQTSSSFTQTAAPFSSRGRLREPQQDFVTISCRRLAESVH